MRNLFFYGTLRHMPLLEIVLGKDTDALDFAQATLPGFEVSSVAEGPFPMIAEKAGAEARGLLVRGLSDADIARLDFYEGGFAFDLVLAPLSDGQQTEVYVPKPGLWTPDGPWDLDRWARDWGALSCHAAWEVMSLMGRRSREEVAQIFSRIRARATARVNAETARHGEGTTQGRIDIDRRNRVYARFYALDELALRFERFDGSMSERVERAIFIGSDAAILLPYDPVRDRVLLIEQVRMGPLARGDKGVWMLEPIAGNIDPGEDPETTARREAMEEAGLEISQLETIAEVYASPGNATEFFYIYLGIADLPDDITGTGGVETEHEDIRSHLLPFEDLIAMADRFSFGNAPLVLAVNWLARHRDRLRSGGAGATSG
ncbi:MAG: NUDIX domain-containing protein [Sulfitobacter sp.]|nr:NUDIX domain-containing protein [Sulfitobacter sp.]